MEIQEIVMLVVFSAIGAYSVFNSILKNMPEEKRSKLRKASESKLKTKLKKPVILFRSVYFSYLKKSDMIHESIHEAIEMGSIKGAFRFMMGMIKLFWYFFKVSLVWYIPSWIIYAITYLFPDGPLVSPSLFSGFCFMLGAGLSSMVLWLKTLNEQKAQGKKMKDEGKRFDALKTRMGIMAKSFILAFVFTGWGMGESFFLYLSPEKSTYLFYFVISGAITLGVILAVGLVAKIISLFRSN